MITPQAARTPVQSSLLSSIRYSIDATLELEFRSGAIYRYFGVPQAVFEGLIAAQSKGAYFNRTVRSRFPYHRLP
jgi:KTSC domain